MTYEPINPPPVHWDCPNCGWLDDTSIRELLEVGLNPEHVQKIADLINHRPRKSLDFLTPYEVLFPHSSDPVALQS
jgi:hypothetical protein